MKIVKDNFATKNLFLGVWKSLMVSFMEWMRKDLACLFWEHSDSSGYWNLFVSSLDSRGNWWLCSEQWIMLLSSLVFCLSLSLSSGRYCREIQIQRYTDIFSVFLECNCLDVCFVIQTLEFVTEKTLILCCGPQLLFFR